MSSTWDRARFSDKELNSQTVNMTIPSEKTTVEIPDYLFRKAKSRCGIDCPGLPTERTSMQSPDDNRKNWGRLNARITSVPDRPPAACVAPSFPGVRVRAATPSATAPLVRYRRPALRAPE